MVTVVPGGNRSSMLGANFGSGFSNQLEKMLDIKTKADMQKSGIQASIDEMRANKTLTPQLEGILNLFKTVGPYDPSGRALGAALPSYLANMQAQASQNTPFGTEGMEAPTQRQPLPAFGQTPGQPEINGGQQQGNAFFPNNEGYNQAPGQSPQTATTGEKRPIYTPDEMSKQAHILGKKRTNEGIPTTTKEAYEEIKGVNEDNKIYNSEIDKERNQRIDFQRDYGPKATAILKKYMPDATPEQEAIFAKMGEEKAGEMKSEADINRYVAGEARKFKNTISNIKDDLSAPRSQNSFQKKLLGTEKDFESASKDLRVKLKPLLDMGLYDTARNLLSDLGYHPEERESVLNPLSDRIKTSMKYMPSSQRPNPMKLRNGKEIPAAEAFAPYKYSDIDKEKLSRGIKEIFKQDPKASLVLVRKAFEDKGYDWRVFKDSLNDLMLSEQFKPDDDQFNQLNYLDSPPLNMLEKVLHSMKLIGR